MFIPNQIAQIASPTGTNVYGEKTYGAWRPIPCGIVKLIETSADTSVRSDSSASRGNAEEKVTMAKLLFPANHAIQLNDRVQIAGCDLRAVAIHKRFDVRGRHDHNEVDFDRWAGS